MYKIKDLKKMPTFTSNDAQINYQTFGDAAKPALNFFKLAWYKLQNVASTD